MYVSGSKGVSGGVNRHKNSPVFNLFCWDDFQYVPSPTQRKRFRTLQTSIQTLKTQTRTLIEGWLNVP